MSKTYSAGIVTAYGAAKRAGYHGTYEDFCRQQAGYAESAAAVEQAKNTAVSAANTATAKATEATTAATAAQTAKEQTEAAASQALTDIGTARSGAISAVQTEGQTQTANARAQALAAAQSATTASTKASEASAFATSAGQSATNAAASATNAASSAGAAQGVLESIPEDYSDLSEDVDQLKDYLAGKSDTADMLKAFPTDTASGAVASFADGANVPVKSMIVNIDPMQSGSGDPSPTNVRPISGWTGCAVSTTGKNLFNKNINLTPYKLINASGDIVDHNSYCYSDYIKINPNTAYVFSGVIVGQTYQSVAFYDNEKSFISRYTPSEVGIQAQFTTPSTCQYIRVNFSITNYANPSNLDTVQLEEGFVASEHEAFGTTIPISWASETGIVYGGKLDVLTGELTVDRKYMKFDGSEDEIWYAYSSTGFRIPMRDIGLSGKGICNLAPTVSSASSYGVMFSASTNYIYFFQTVSEWGVSTVTDLRTWLATNNVEVCYSLATPITYQLTPQEVTSLLGKNNIWADTGDTAVEYRADPTLYIRQLTEPDEDMVADANITSGQYFMVGNTLYKATTNIASGAIISPNVNCTRKSLSEALNELNI